MKLVFIKPIDRALSGATLPARVDLGAITMKENSAFPKAPASLEPHHQIFSIISWTLIGGGLPPAEVQSMYSKATADWERHGVKYQKCFIADNSV